MAFAAPPTLTEAVVDAGKIVEDGRIGEPV
jgi:hypothetical protein